MISKQLKKRKALQLLIECMVIALALLITTLILDPIERSVFYENAKLLYLLSLTCSLSIYWFFFLNQSLLLKSIYIKSVLMVVIVFLILKIVGEFFNFADIMDSYDLSLFGSKKKPMTVNEESTLLDYIYKSHLLLFSISIIGLLLLEFKLLKSILTFIARMR